MFDRDTFLVFGGDVSACFFHISDSFTTCSVRGNAREREQLETKLETERETVTPLRRARSQPRATRRGRPRSLGIDAASP
eukprot:9466911-Pyramimonas_sp.AAC.2